MKDFDNLSDSGIVEKSFTQIDDTTLLDLDLENIKQPYDPNSDEQICCIELVNNNKVYISYESDWTIRNLISAVISHKEFKKLYQNRDWQINSERHLQLFDLHLILYRSLKSETETKIDFDIRLQELRELGLLKSHKYPFFVFKDNRNPGNKIAEELSGDNKFEICKTIADSNFEHFTVYQNYLPRVNTLLLLRSHPELEEYYLSNKRGVNMLTKFHLNPLISEDENLDWFIYDDESLNFLLDVEKMEFHVLETVRCSLYNENKVYFQDKYPYILLSNKEYKTFFIVLTFGAISMKVESSLITTALDLLKKINTKLGKMKAELCFEPKNKILKVQSLNDYIIDLEEPLGKFAYINECIKSNRIPEYIVIDNPFLLEQEELERAQKLRGSISFVGSELEDSRLGLFSCAQQIRDLNSTTIFKKHHSKIFTVIDEEPQSAKPSTTTQTNNGSTAEIKDKQPLPETQTTNDPNSNSNPQPTITNDAQKSIWDKVHPNIKQLLVNDAEKKKNENINKLFNIASFQPQQEKQSNIRVSSNVKGKITSAQIDPFEYKALSKKKDGLEDLMKKITLAINSKVVNTIEERSKSLEEGESSAMISEESEENIEEYNRMRARGVGIKITSQEMDIQGDLNNTKIMRSRLNDTLASLKLDSSIGKIKLDESSGNLSLPAISKGSMKKIRTPNLFKEVKATRLPIEKRLDEKNESININDLLRPFSITVRSIELDKLYNSAFDEKKDFMTVMLFKMQFFCGSEPFSKARQIKWRTHCHDKNPVFNKRIYFDLSYNTLPMFSSILFKLKQLKFDKNSQMISHNTIGWVNFRLFDHNRRLKTDNHQMKNAINVTFELESFMLPVENKIIEYQATSYNPYSYMISETDNQKIYEILEKTPFDEMNNYDKEVLWSNRYALTQIPSIIPKLLSCVDYKNATHLKELEKILKLAKNLSPVQALQLLTGQFLHESIRKFAVSCLSQASHIEVQDFLIQLVQALKFEMYHNSHLARYLLKLAIRYPLTIGHYLFWSMRSEMYNPNVQQRFGLYLEVFLNKIGKNLSCIFADESWLIRSLLEVADIPHNKKIKSNEEKLLKFKEALEKLNEHFEKSNKEISMPLNFKMRVKKFITEKCKVMKSKKKPLWLVFQNADPQGDNVVVMFKKGDDLRMDIITLQLFKVMHSLWFEEKINLKMSLYNVICTGYFQGMLEIVKESETLATIHKMFGGATASLTSKPLKKWMEKTCTCTEIEYVANFLVTSVAYSVATFVLGVGDRHNDNIMVKKNGELFHIDFGHFLGHFKYKYGIKRERAPFVFTKEFRKVLGGKNGENFKQFQQLCLECYHVLRKNADVLVTLLRMVLCTGISELTEKSIKSSLSLNYDKKQADKFIKEKLNESLSSISTRINFAIHVLANK